MYVYVYDVYRREERERKERGKREEREREREREERENVMVSHISLGTINCGPLGAFALDVLSSVCV